MKSSTKGGGEARRWGGDDKSGVRDHSMGKTKAEGTAASRFLLHQPDSQDMRPSGSQEFETRPVGSGEQPDQKTDSRGAASHGTDRCRPAGISERPGVNEKAYTGKIEF